MTKIVPAVLVDNKEDYLKRVSVIRQLTNRFQLDIIDGQYVDNRTIQLDDISRPTDLNMDVHLMVSDPKPYVEQAIVLHANNIIIQLECCEDISGYLERIKKSGLNAGAAINPDTKLTALKPYKDILDHVLIMGYPAGFAGQKLNPLVFERLPEVRDMFPAAEIGLDGGLSPSNAKKVLQAGFDVVNINTLIFGNEDPLSAYSELLGYII
jgi:ribulose-phosphate 3-epimerase